MSDFNLINVLLPDGPMKIAGSSKSEGPGDGGKAAADANREAGGGTAVVPTLEASEQEKEATFPSLSAVMDTLDFYHKRGFITSRPLATVSRCGDGTTANHISCITEKRFTGEVVSSLLRLHVGCITGYGSVNVLPLEYHMARRGDKALQSAEDHKKEGGDFFTSQLDTLRFIENVEKGGHLTFDYCALLVVASVIAGVGLATDNTVVIVASMLVSPLMGPVLATTVAMCCSSSGVHMMRIQDGLVTGSVSLAVCIAIGLVIGFFCAPLKGVAETWPTTEMSSRGEASGLAVGTIIALASGVGVSLSGLSSNANSLVGVAISASLLPPAVNAGMCWSFAIFGGRIGYDSYVDDADRREYVVIGFVSLALTLLNIVCVFMAGWLIFRAKMQLQMLRIENSEDGNMTEQVHSLVQATVKKNSENTDIREALDEAIKNKRERMDESKRANSCCFARPSAENDQDEDDRPSEEAAEPEMGASPGDFAAAVRSCWGTPGQIDVEQNPISESDEGEEPSPQVAPEPTNEEPESLPRDPSSSAAEGKQMAAVFSAIDQRSSMSVHEAKGTSDSDNGGQLLKKLNLPQDLFQSPDDENDDAPAADSKPQAERPVPAAASKGQARDPVPTAGSKPQAGGEEPPAAAAAAGDSKPSTPPPTVTPADLEHEERVRMWKLLDPKDSGFVNVQGLLKHESWLNVHVPDLVDNFPRLANMDSKLSREKFMRYSKKVGTPKDKTPSKRSNEAEGGTGGMTSLSDISSIDKL